MKHFFQLFFLIYKMIPIVLIWLQVPFMQHLFLIKLLFPVRPFLNFLCTVLVSSENVPIIPVQLQQDNLLRNHHADYCKGVPAVHIRTDLCNTINVALTEPVVCNMLSQ